MNSQPSTITVTVKLFAAYQDTYGVPELRLALPTNTSVGEVRDRLIAERPELEKWRNVTRFGINLDHVQDPNTPLHDGDEVVLIPPVSGGTID